MHGCGGSEDVSPAHRFGFLEYSLANSRASVNPDTMQEDFDEHAGANISDFRHRGSRCFPAEKPSEDPVGYQQRLDGRNHGVDASRFNEVVDVAGYTENCLGLTGWTTGF